MRSSGTVRKREVKGKIVFFYLILLSLLFSYIYNNNNNNNDIGPLPYSNCTDTIGSSFHYQYYYYYCRVGNRYSALDSTVVIGRRANELTKSNSRVCRT